MTNPGPTRKVDMDHSTTEATDSLQAALRMGALGYKIVPIPPGEKYPKGLTEWQKRATDDEAQITDWWGSGERGIGWAMGLQPNGRFLVAIDVDVNDGKVGKQTIEALIKEHGLSSAFKNTTSQRTGTGGYHFVFSMPRGVEIGNGTLGQHVDTRGEGGFIVVAPTIHPNGSPYRWTKAPWEIEPRQLPWRLANLLADEEEPPRQPAPSLPTGGLRGYPPRVQGAGVDDTDPIEWIKSNFTCEDFIERLGWQRGPTAGTETKYTRPGKSVKEGSSATYHSDTDVINIFTTTVDPEFENFGHHSRSGVLTLNAFDLWCIANGMTSVSAGMSAVRKTLMPRETAVTPGVTAVSTIHEAEHVPESAGLNLPDEFWRSRPVLEHIRQAAWSRMEAPDAVLGTMLARYAACIPVTYRIPAVVGAPATFDHLSVLVGESSGGKSVAMSIARELFPGPQYDTIVWDLPVPTGEGLISSFFEEVAEDDGSGKRKLVNKKVRDAVHFSIDEGMALIQAGAQRQGTTIASVLCSAWTGQNPGQANASKERRRIDLKPYTFRVSGVMGIQFALGHHLLAETWVDQGLSGRLLFFSTEDASIPFDTPPWPGPLDLPVHPTAPVELVYDPTIHTEVRTAHHAKKTRQVTEAPIDGHQRLVRLKISGILALLDGRTSVDLGDWELAGMIFTSSRAIRDAMLAVASEARHRDNVTKATAAGTYEAIKQDAISKSNRDKAVRQILRRLDTHRDGMKRQDLRRSLSTTEVKQMLDEAIEALVDLGQIVEVDGVWKIAR